MSILKPIKKSSQDHANSQNILINKIFHFEGPIQSNSSIQFGLTTQSLQNFDITVISFFSEKADKVNGRTDTLFREMVKFSNIQKF